MHELNPLTTKTVSTKIKCVILDDDPFAMEMLKDILKGIQNIDIIQCFYNPLEFLGALPSLDFNLIFLDIMMPEIDGFEVAKHLEDKLIIFLTGNPEEFASNASKFCPIDILSKPYKKEKLLESLKKIKSLHPVI